MRTMLPNKVVEQTPTSLPFVAPLVVIVRPPTPSDA